MAGEFGPLNSAFWKDNDRLQEARSTAFRSINRDRTDDNRTEAVQLLQKALLLLQGELPILFGDVPIPLARPYGPYQIPNTEHDPDDATKCVFGLFTKKAVEDVQAKSFIEVDGKAGIHTLRAMDDSLVVNFDSFVTATP